MCLISKKEFDMDQKDGKNHCGDSAYINNLILSSKV